MKEKLVKGLFKDFSYESLDYFHNCHSSVRVDYKKSNVSYTVIANVVLSEDDAEENSGIHINYKNCLPKTKKVNADSDILVARFVDRILRPTIQGFTTRDVTVNILSLSNIPLLQDQQVLASVAAIIAIKKLIPIDIGVCRAVLRNGELVINPIGESFKESDLEIIVSGNKKKILAIESEGKFVSYSNTEKFIKAMLDECEEFKKHLETVKTIKHLKEEEIEELDLDLSEYVIEKIKKEKTETSRRQISSYLCKKQQRLCTRKLDEIREIKIEEINKNCVVFQRGDTVCAAFVEIQMGQQEPQKNNLNVKYFFNSFASGELVSKKQVTRRELGHADLIRKSFQKIVHSSIPINISAEVLSANGSTSMASVCASSSVLYQNGIIKENEIVAGLSYGAFSNKDTCTIVTDIVAEEDNFSDFDFKIAGSKEGVTSIQLDAKSFLMSKYLKDILNRAKKDLGAICDKISNIESSNEQKTETIKLSKDRLGLIIGSNGSNIKQIARVSGVKIKVHQDGNVVMHGKSLDLAKKLLKFYGMDILKEKEEIAFFAKEDFSGKIIPTTLASINVAKSITGKAGQVILATVKDEWSKKSVAKAQVLDII